MKKCFIIILLASLQCACAGQPLPAQGSNHTLLSFADLANEITVDFEDISAAVTPEQSDNEELGTP